MLYNVHRFETPNVGDRYSSPVGYFDWLDDAQRIDAAHGDITGHADSIQESAVIIGGGGLLDRGRFANLHNLYKFGAKQLILWGAGHNNFDGGPIGAGSPELDQYDLVGTRDHGTNYDWVPCVSCMDPLFTEEHVPSRDVVVYEFMDMPIPNRGVPTLTNAAETLEEVVDFLGQAETVVTNTYHGMYWATLLGRKVVLIPPSSNRFSAFLYQPVTADLQNWPDMLDSATAYPTALQETREANMFFAERVKKLVSNSV